MRFKRAAAASVYGCWGTLLLIALCVLVTSSTKTRADDALEMNDLQQLVAPIALYPDALLAQVLTASTYPDDVIAAARWMDAGNNPAGIDSQPWDSSVKGVARYPTVLHYMAGNANWLNDLGDAFLHQEGDVMAAVQNLRGQALAAGTLVNTSQQTVVNVDGSIQIIPTDPQYLCAPIYDPQVVYSPPQYAEGAPYPTYITFGPQVVVGDWLDFDFDWHDHAIYHGGWGRDRPWWHDRDHHYLDHRPGVYEPGRFRDDHDRVIVVKEDHSAHDDHRPAPRRAPGPPPRAVSIERPERGYPDRGPANRQPDAARDSERGKESRAAAAHPATPAPAKEPVREPHVQRAPEPAPRAPEPARVAPRAPEPARAAPSAPTARPSAPTRGGAMGGYQSGDAASHAAARGAASRGGKR